MSFTSTIKEEVATIMSDTLESRSELSAIIRNIGTVNKNITISTENISTAHRIIKLLRETYDITPSITVRKGYNFNKNYLYIITINNKINTIIKDLSLENEIPKEYIIDDESLKQAYLRGTFISVGSINDPKKSRYHLEFLVNTKQYAIFIQELLNKFYLNSKIIDRNNKYMIYVKEAEKIGDFLRIIEAPKAVMYYEDIRIFRDHMNMTNRLNNCEQANVDKSISAANEIIKDIEYLKEKDIYELLSDKEKLVAEYRTKYPEASLVELARIIQLEASVSLTKSGLHHRLNKIHIFAQKNRNK